MKMIRWRDALAACSALALAACGGGGGGSGAPAGPGTAPPASGSYGWLLKAEGPNDNPKLGLSLIHAQDSSTEWVIETPSAAVTHARVVASATVDAATLQSPPLEPYALVYIVGGDVRRVPLRADGSAPASRVQRAQTSSACRFVVDAVDYGAPEQSRFVLATAGGDGVCGNADDGRAELQLHATLGLVLTPLADADAPLAVLRDAATLAPQAWLGPTSVQAWSGARTDFRTADQPLTRVVLATPRSALVESARGLSVIDVAAAGAATETALAGLTGGGWQALGFDSNYFFTWRNAGGSWVVQRISRSTPAATLMNSGSGEITLASIGNNVLYVSTLEAGQSRLRRMPKDVPGNSQLLHNASADANLALVLTGNDGAHMLTRASGLNGSNPSYQIEIIDEQGNVLHTSAAGGLSLGLVEAARLDFGRSDNRSRFLFVEGFNNSRYFGDAVLVSYDGATRSATRLGTLPGSAAFGNDGVFADVTVGSLAIGTGFASRTISGVVQAAGTQVFSFDPGQANSLKFTTRQQ